MKNIVLIGMPGSGKTTILHKLGEKLGWPIMDTDLYIVAKQGKTVQEMFDISEQYFRDIETRTYNEISSLEGYILATGGGAVKRAENIEYLKRNGVTFLLNRTPENIIADIDISGRPLLRDGADKIWNLYRERKDLYLKYADVIVDNNGDIDDVVDFIVNRVKDWK